MGSVAEAALPPPPFFSVICNLVMINSGGEGDRAGLLFSCPWASHPADLLSLYFLPILLLLPSTLAVSNSFGFDPHPGRPPSSSVGALLRDGWNSGWVGSAPLRSVPSKAQSDLKAQSKYIFKKSGSLKVSTAVGHFLEIGKRHGSCSWSFRFHHAVVKHNVILAKNEGSFWPSLSHSCFGLSLLPSLHRPLSLPPSPSCAVSNRD